MNVLFCAGALTSKTVKAIKALFTNGNMVFLPCNNIDDVCSVLDSGEFMDRAVVMESGVHDKNSEFNEYELRLKISAFANLMSNKVDSNTTCVMVAFDERMANIMFEETLPISNRTSIFVVDRQFTVNMGADICHKNLDQIEEKYAKFKFNAEYADTSQDTGVVIFSSSTDSDAEEVEELESISEMQSDEIEVVTDEDVEEGINAYNGEEIENFDDLDGIEDSIDSVDNTDENDNDDIYGNLYDDNDTDEQFTGIAELEMEDEFSGMGEFELDSLTDNEPFEDELEIDEDNIDDNSEAVDDEDYSVNEEDSDLNVDLNSDTLEIEAEDVINSDMDYSELNIYPGDGYSSDEDEDELNIGEDELNIGEDELGESIEEPEIDSSEPNWDDEEPAWDNIDAIGDWDNTDDIEEENWDEDSSDKEDWSNSEETDELEIGEEQLTISTDDEYSTEETEVTDTDEHYDIDMSDNIGNGAEIGDLIIEEPDIDGEISEETGDEQVVGENSLDDVGENRIKISLQKEDEYVHPVSARNIKVSLQKEDINTEYDVSQGLADEIANIFSAEATDSVENTEYKDDIANIFNEQNEAEEVSTGNLDNTTEEPKEDNNIAELFGTTNNSVPEAFSNEMYAENNDNETVVKENNKKKHTKLNKGTKKSDDSVLKTLLESYKNSGSSLVVTGTSSSGKTTVAYNLAKLIADMGNTVLIVDMDINRRGQTYISKQAYDAVHSISPENFSLKKALNGVNQGVGKFVNIVEPGMHLLSTGLCADITDLNSIINISKLHRFTVGVKSNYTFIIYDIPFEYLDICADIVYTSDRVIITCAENNNSIMNTMLTVSNIEDDDMQQTIFTKAKLCFTKCRKQASLLGKNISNTKDILVELDKLLLELIGVEPEYLFSQMEICGNMKYDDAYDNLCFSSRSYVDTAEGKEQYAKLLQNILTTSD